MSDRNEHVIADDPLLTREEVAEELKVSVRTVDRYIDAGDLVATRLPGGRLVRVRRSSVTALATAGERAS